MAERFEKAAATIRSEDAPAIVSFVDIAYPRSIEECKALDGNGVLYIATLTRDQTILPMQAASVIFNNQRISLSPLYSVVSNLSGSRELSAKKFGPYRSDVLYLFPIALRLKPADLVLSFGETGKALKLMSFSATVPSQISEIMIESTGRGPSEQRLSNLIQEELAGVLQTPRQSRSSPGTKKELDEISARGKKLAQYDQAAWHATDALMQTKANRELVSVYIAVEQNGHWAVNFGRLNQNRDKFLVSYEARQQEDPTKFAIGVLETPREETGFLLAAARAAEVARADFGIRPKPYNIAFLPDTSGGVFVYFLAAQTNIKAYPLGGDVRYLISADGSHMIEKRVMHLAVLEYSPADSNKMNNSFHTAVLDDVPEDSDVFHVLVRKPISTELVFTPQFTYTIQVDGSIQYLMKTKDFLRATAP